MDIELKNDKGLENETRLFLHGSDMLQFAFENQNECDKSFFNVSAFDVNFKNMICNTYSNGKQGNDYIVIDFVQTASMMLEDENWKAQMDEYVDCISQYFEHNKIILIRTTIPDTRANFSIIKPFFCDYNDKLNNVIKQFEDYFISKMNPYVIDLSRNYFLEKNHKFPDSNVCFEDLYNKDIRHNVHYIVSNQPLQKTFDTPNYEYTLQRFLQFYDNLYNKQMTSTILDKRDLVNRIVLNMSRHTIEKNITDICDLKKCGYHSYEEILNNHDFKENHNFKKIVFVIIHIFNKDIVNSQLDYSVIFKENLKVKKLLSVQVNQKLKSLGIAQNVIVTIFNVEAYHRILFLYMNKQYKKAINALIDAYYTCTKPILIDNWGSCVSRVPLNLDSGTYKVNYFINRCCFLNEFDEPVDSSKIDFDTTGVVESWNLRCFRDSLEKVSKIKIQESKAKWLVVDFFDTINELAIFRNAIVDYSEDNQNNDYFKKFVNECEPFSFYDKPDEGIQERMDKFIHLVKNKYQNNIILVNLTIREHYLDGARKIKTLDVEDLEEKNRFVTKWQNYFVEQTNCYCIDLAKYFLGDDQSLFGVSIVHYEEGFNQEVFKYVDYIIQKQPEKKIFDDYSKALKIERLIEIKSNNSDLLLIKPLFQHSEYDSYLFSLSLEELKEMQEQEPDKYHYLGTNTIR